MQRTSCCSISSVILLFMYVTECNAELNIHMEPKVFKLDETNGDFFGASLALNDEAVYVGAPKYQKHGGIFRCDLDETRCKALNGFTGIQKT